RNPRRQCRTLSETGIVQYPTVAEIVYLQRRLIETSGGSHGIREQGQLESAVSQSQMTFGGQELYPTLYEKAAALGFSLIMNHPFLDGNKRIGHAAMELLLRRNGHRLSCETDEQERIILSVAAGELKREEFVEWVKDHI